MMVACSKKSWRTCVDRNAALQSITCQYRDTHDFHVPLALATEDEAIGNDLGIPAPAHWASLQVPSPLSLGHLVLLTASNNRSILLGPQSSPCPLLPQHFPPILVPVTRVGLVCQLIHSLIAISRIIPVCLGVLLIVYVSFPYSNQDPLLWAIGQLETPNFHSVTQYDPCIILLTDSAHTMLPMAHYVRKHCRTKMV